MQSVTWEGVRNLFPDHFKRNQSAMRDVKNTWSLYADKKLSLPEARALITERALEGGGSLTPDWAKAKELVLAAGIPAAAVTSVLGSENAVAADGGGQLNTLNLMPEEHVGADVGELRNQLNGETPAPAAPPTRAQLEDAIIAADAAGDIEAA